MRPRGSFYEQNPNISNVNSNPPKNEESSSSDKKQKSRNTRGVSAYAKTNALGLVSIILIIGMIATMFFAVSYSGKQQFKYFSPRKYLTNLSFNEVNMPDSWHQLLFVEQQSGELFPTYVRAYFEYDGIFYFSKNRYLAGTSNVYDKEYVFEIGGSKYYSELVQVGEYNGEPLYANLIHLPAISYNLFDVPDISTVGAAWQQVEGLDGTLVNAFSVTGKFLIEGIAFEVRLIDRIIPWNSVENSDRSWLDNIWHNKEIELGFDN